MEPADCRRTEAERRFRPRQRLQKRIAALVMSGCFPRSVSSAAFALPPGTKASSRPSLCRSAVMPRIARAMTGLKRNPNIGAEKAMRENHSGWSCAARSSICPPIEWASAIKGFGMEGATEIISRARSRSNCAKSPICPLARIGKQPVRKPLPAPVHRDDGEAPAAKLARNLEIFFGKLGPPAEQENVPREQSPPAHLTAAQPRPSSARSQRLRRLRHQIFRKQNERRAQSCDPSAFARRSIWAGAAPPRIHRRQCGSCPAGRPCSGRYGAGRWRG